jgi:hypothetical protein
VTSTSCQETREKRMRRRGVFVVSMGLALSRRPACGPQPGVGLGSDRHRPATSGRSDQLINRVAAERNPASRTPDDRGAAE